MDTNSIIKIVQLGRRNLTPVQRIAVAKKYEDKLKEKAKENQSLNGGDKKTDSSNWNPPISKMKTTKEIARLANVGTGTLARYDVVMKLVKMKIEKILVLTKK